MTYDQILMEISTISGVALNFIQQTFQSWIPFLDTPYQGMERTPKASMIANTVWGECINVHGDITPCTPTDIKDLVEEALMVYFQENPGK